MYTNVIFCHFVSGYSQVLKTPQSLTKTPDPEIMDFGGQVMTKEPRGIQDRTGYCNPNV